MFDFCSNKRREIPIAVDQFEPVFTVPYLLASLLVAAAIIGLFVYHLMSGIEPAGLLGSYVIIFSVCLGVTLLAFLTIVAWLRLEYWVCSSRILRVVLESVCRCEQLSVAFLDREGNKMALVIDGIGTAAGWRDTVEEADRASAEQSWEMLLKDGSASIITTERRGEGAQYFKYSFYRPVRDPGFPVIQLKRNRTADVKERAVIAETYRLCREALEQSGVAVFAVDKDLYVEFANAMAKSLLALEFDVCGNNDGRQRLPSFLAAQWKQLLANTEGEPPGPLRLLNSRDQVWYQIRVAVHSNGYFVYLTDCSEQVAREAMNRQEVVRNEIGWELESLGDWEYNIDSEQLRLSPRAREILGVEGEIAGRELFRAVKTIRSRDRLKLTRSLLAISAGEERAGFDLELLPDANGARVVRTFMRSVKGMDGKPEKVIGILRDISHEKQKELALQQSAAFIRAVIDALPGQICVIDATGTLQMVNRSWRDTAIACGCLLDWDNGQVNYLEVCRKSGQLGCEDAVVVLKGLESIIKGRRRYFTCEYTLSADNLDRHFVLHANRIEGNEHAVDELLIVISHEDITARLVPGSRLPEQAPDA